MRRRDEEAPGATAFRQDECGTTMFVHTFQPLPRMLVFATAARFPEADEVVVDWPHRYLATELAAGRADARTVAAVLTHDTKFDGPVARPHKRRRAPALRLRCQANANMCSAPRDVRTLDTNAHGLPQRHRGHGWSRPWRRSTILARQNCPLRPLHASDAVA